MEPQKDAPDPIVPRRGDYEPPRMERVLAQEELEREVLYAGVIEPTPPG